MWGRNLKEIGIAVRQIWIISRRPDFRAAPPWIPGTAERNLAGIDEAKAKGVGDRRGGAKFRERPMAG